jgi:hypothetical protein
MIALFRMLLLLCCMSMQGMISLDQQERLKELADSMAVPA